MSIKRSFSSKSSKKNRRSVTIQTVWRPKNCQMPKDSQSVLEGSQKRKSILPDLPPSKSQESYHDSSVDKVQ